MAELIAARDAATATDMVELRLDGVADLDVARALAGRDRPAIVTCRPTWEGGRFTGSEEERYRILVLALEQGAEHVDVEWAAGPEFLDLVRRAPGRIVLSMHDFAGVPADLTTRVRAMRATGAAVIKVAVRAARLCDTLPLLDIGRGGDAVVIGMGDAGVPSRLLAARFGSRWTYAGHGAAPGQLPAAAMIERFRFRQVGESTAIYGVVGDNVLHSLSPIMHNAAFAAAGLDAVYVPLRAADFDDFLTFAEALGVAGASVTIPFKVDALNASASADALTREVGAANTLRRIGSADAAAAGRATGAAAGNRTAWEATNTDVAGFLEPLDALFRSAAGTERLERDDSGLRVAVLGAGGAARAAIVALRSRGAQVTVHARHPERARMVVSGFDHRVQAGPWPPPPGSWDVLVNCTPLGSAAARDASPFAGPFDGGVVYDLTYGPAESPLLRAARLSGCRTLDGLPMLVAQAERQFEWWTGRRPQTGIMRAAAYSEVSSSTRSEERDSAATRPAEPAAHIGHHRCT